LGNRENISIYLKQIHNTNTLSEKEKEKLFRAIKKNGKNSEKARLRIIQDNLSLVVSLAKKYYYPGMNIEFLDFVEEGNIGLVRAVEKYDISKGFKFSTYASWWIEKHFQDALLKSRSIIQMPEKTWRYMKKIESTTADLLQQTGQIPDIKDVSKKIDISISELREVLLATIRMKNIKSLDYYIDGDKTITLESIIAKDEACCDELVDKISREETISSLMGVLDETEREVIKLRFALLDDKKYTYKEIAELLKISPSKAKELQERAIKKLRRKADQDI
jgi:RNA polymerase primary sigma factor